MPKEKGGLDLRGMTIPHHEDASGANAPSPDEGGASRADAYYCNSRGRFSEGGTDEGNRSWVSSRPQPLRGLVDGLLVRGHVHGVSLQHGPVPTIDCRATNSEAVGLIVAQLASAMAWGGEVIKRLTQTQREANDIRRHFDEMAEHCTQLKVRLAELEEVRDREERAAEAQSEGLETQGLRLAAEKRL
ncbi:mediator of RNA polymerase II transcription subunit 21-like [Dorcoceras hygrometricum]|uniref:Mediator of RNA polymerase II transcription subunit 21-like n=1 Tax=Dorcoceras hygrometricum TaxID=472368 RepID=A0A2Z7A9L8_9LAMI|nr:mediator of RNA polymerase II transcription subunit 21-like [Dorcoceras hygrometricum]